MPTLLKFSAATDAPFYATLRRRVDTYFRTENLSRHANGAMWTKTVLFLGSFLVLYSLVLLGPFGPGTRLILACLLGACNAFIGFNICHDALHGSFSANPRVNRAFGLLFNLVGANPYVWTLTHNLVHHTFTNIPGHDEDIEVAPGLLRLSPEEAWRPWQRYQHLYAFPLYGLASLSWVFRKDFVKFFQTKIGQHTARHPRREYVNLFAYKALYYLLFIAVPLWVVPLPWGQVLLGFVALHLVEGVVMGLVFQLAHVVEGTAFPAPDSSGTMPEAWAVHQLRTTANFAPHSRLAAFFCGGLNRQIEHHLFPRVCHIHYPALAAIVRQTAQEFGLPYLENPSFGAALRSHYGLLRRLSRPHPVASPAHLQAVHP